MAVREYEAAKGESASGHINRMSAGGREVALAIDITYRVEGSGESGRNSSAARAGKWKQRDVFQQER